MSSKGSSSIICKNYMTETSLYFLRRLAICLLQKAGILSEIPFIRPNGVRTSRRPSMVMVMPLNISEDIHTASPSPTQGSSA
jgi:hypothetical protein